LASKNKGDGANDGTGKSCGYGGFGEPDRAGRACEAGAVAAATREVCTEISWGYDGVRTDCRFKVLAAEAPNPALKGLCTTYYGRRTCH
jgi:hypothetical protein